MFKIEEKFNGTEALYDYLLKNIKFIGKSIGVQIQEPLKDKPFCITGKEKETGKNFLFFASKSLFPECLEELIALSETFSFDVIVFFVPKLNLMQLESINWIENICNSGTQFIISEADF